MPPIGYIDHARVDAEGGSGKHDCGRCRIGRQPPGLGLPPFLPQDEVPDPQERRVVAKLDGARVPLRQRAAATTQVYC